MSLLTSLQPLLWQLKLHLRQLWVTLSRIQRVWRESELSLTQSSKVTTESLSRFWTNWSTSTASRILSIKILWSKRHWDSSPQARLHPRWLHSKTLQLANWSSKKDQSFSFGCKAYTTTPRNGKDHSSSSQRDSTQSLHSSWHLMAKRETHSVGLPSAEARESVLERHLLRPIWSLSLPTCHSSSTWSL